MNTTSPATCDLCDAHEEDTSGAFRVLPPVFRDFGASGSFSGPVATLRALEDNSRIREAVNSPGEGRVLVVEGGGSVRRALVGGNLALAAAK
ncbi:MAG TPA: ribonuclease, partial [Ramlibacter sp.]|nr:ribonuclease [Ramlibacter sp.]